MSRWQDICLENISIEKNVAEFNVWDVKNAPYAKYKVKVFESAEGKYTAYTNLQLIDFDGTPYCGVGYGESIERALEDSIQCFMKMCNERDTLTERDFCYINPGDF